jgi:hypothetical protein
MKTTLGNYQSSGEEDPRMRGVEMMVHSDHEGEEEVASPPSVASSASSAAWTVN